MDGIELSDAGVEMAPAIAALHRACFDQRRHKNVALNLLFQVAGTPRRRGIVSLFLEVAADNKAALALYCRLDFQQISQRKGYYTINGGDALVLRLNLSQFATT